MNLNYIKQQQLFFERARKDRSLTAYHQSMYVHLFLQWNKQHFDPCLEINREEIMAIAGIGSKTTYYNCLKGLSRAGYIQYDPEKRSVVKMIPLYEEPDSPDSGTSNDPISGTSTITDGPVSGTADIPLIGQQTTIPGEAEVLKERHAIMTKTVFKKNTNSTNTFHIPSLDEVIVFFDSQKYTLEEAGIFWDYFDKKDWKTREGPVRNWKGLAKKFIIDHRNKKTENEKQGPKKDYNES
jgi:hypothetical protein